MRPFASRVRVVAVMLAIALVIPALASGATKTKTLYQRLGGKKGITAVVEDFVTRLNSDTRVNSFFAATTADPARLTRFKTHLIEQLSQASGGKVKYTGKDMKTAHEGMKITSDNFNAVVEDLTGALDKCKVGADEKNELLGVLGPMKPDIAGSGE